MITFERALRDPAARQLYLDELFMANRSPFVEHISYAHDAHEYVEAIWRAYGILVPANDDIFTVVDQTACGILAHWDSIARNNQVELFVTAKAFNDSPTGARELASTVLDGGYTVAQDFFMGLWLPSGQLAGHSELQELAKSALIDVLTIRSAATQLRRSDDKGIVGSTTIRDAWYRLCVSYQSLERAVQQDHRVVREHLALYDAAIIYEEFPPEVTM